MVSYLLVLLLQTAIILPGSQGFVLGPGHWCHRAPCIQEPQTQAVKRQKKSEASFGIGCPESLHPNPGSLHFFQLLSWKKKFFKVSSFLQA